VAGGGGYDEAGPGRRWPPPAQAAGPAASAPQWCRCCRWDVGSQRRRWHRGRATPGVTDGALERW